MLCKKRAVPFLREMLTGLTKFIHIWFLYFFWKNLSVFAAAGHPAPLHFRKMQKLALDLPQSGTYKIGLKNFDPPKKERNQKHGRNQKILPV